MPDQIRALQEGISSTYAALGRVFFCVRVCSLPLCECSALHAYGFGFNELGASLTPPCRSCNEVIV